MHRDIKSSNLTVVTLQTPWAGVIEFGTAKNQTTFFVGGIALLHY